ncbi:hypothetical protein F2Q69_00005509 [Brassica cretica]|uniref:Uncharacterized protein n=1 Tax=Brassica cretica TaxID=69181 RepID=A0A8S9PC49_BRACR|nr:hypothetical protein F2Q69_00005509 [Brassica cretica]
MSPLIDNNKKESIDNNIVASIDESSRTLVFLETTEKISQQSAEAPEQEQSTLAETSLVEIDQRQWDGYEHSMEKQETKEGVQSEKRVTSRKVFIPKYLRREVNKVELDGFHKRVKRVPKDMSFEDAYYKTLKKEQDPGKFLIPCCIRDTGSAVSIMAIDSADLLGLKMEPSQDSFTFVDNSKANSAGMIKNVKSGGFHKRVKRVPKDMSFEDAYYKYRLGNFFIESRETDKDIEMLFNKVWRKPKRTLKKEQDPGKFLIPCCIHDHTLPNALCDTGSAVSIMAIDTGDLLGLKEPSQDSFTFVDNSKANSAGMIKNVKMFEDPGPTADFNREPAMPESASVDIRVAASVHFQFSESIDNKPSESDDSQSSESIDTKLSASVDTLRVTEQPETEKSKSGVRNKNRKKKKKRNADADSLSVVPLQCQEGSLEYRVRCKGGSESFTKARVLYDSLAHRPMRPARYRSCIHDHTLPNALCDTGSAVSIMAIDTADLLGLKKEPSQDSFTFVDNSKANSAGMIKNVKDLQLISFASPQYHNQRRSTLELQNRSTSSPQNRSAISLQNQTTLSLQNRSTRSFQHRSIPSDFQNSPRLKSLNLGEGTRIERRKRKGMHMQIPNQ